MLEGRFFFGFGFDIHPLKEGRKLYLGGVEIPYSQGAYGHSDGDVLLHALIDAGLSAGGFPDIGTLFPDSDPQFKDIRSSLLLQKTLKLLLSKNLKFYQVDLTLVLDAPPIAPFYSQIKENLGSLLGLSPEKIGLKARRGEGILFSQDKPAIMCFALVVLEKLDFSDTL
ncbi:MAG: 2-C-methyl-D-erythritol 2,4-cyclodiphosphate synthase [Caldimicrobium sp.]|nr:2-C-methyl-D-erythritol 2,4-cyclodiphosphate synthase [Caldimicrobium sp.]MCX7873767.1 2-C-methyl-D-erythritol 2,4-cyclodiphosphate synthase [Caldimicrobium sp.]MDW8093691.1 2-C-methyl-D-erythritol 2,4-cyclodiphosphate synthase [Caldimicrobium sp.]